jgi:hypothetical protein
MNSLIQTNSLSLSSTFTRFSQNLIDSCIRSVFCPMQLTPMRPRRPDTESRSRPTSSEQFKAGSRPLTIQSGVQPSSASQTVRIAPSGVLEGQTADYDEPPPLPEKSHSDYANLAQDAASPTPDGLLMRRRTHRDRVQPHCVSNVHVYNIQ